MGRVGDARLRWVGGHGKMGLFFRRKRRFFRVRGWISLILLLGSLLALWPPVQSLTAVHSLSDPAKLATLGKRGANPRVNKIVYWLNRSDEWHVSPEFITYTALLLNGTHGEHGKLVSRTLLRNLKIAHELGLLTPENQAKLRRGNAATVTRGPYRGEIAEIDHIVPVSLAPEIGNDLANLEMMPSSLNRLKSDRVGERQLSCADDFYRAGILTRDSYERLRRRAVLPAPAPSR